MNTHQGRLNAAMNMTNMQAHAIHQYQSQLSVLQSQLADAATSNQTQFEIYVQKDTFKFNASHFVAYPGFRERLHGHNYQVAAEIEDDLKADHLVFDFIEFKKILQGITDSLDHRMLIPLNSDTLGVEVTEEKVRISSEEKEWIIPRDDCVLLPIENTTAELLARWVSEQLSEKLEARLGQLPRILRVEVFESPGQSATIELRNSD